MHFFINKISFIVILAFIINAIPFGNSFARVQDTLYKVRRSKEEEKKRQEEERKKELQKKWEDYNTSSSTEKLITDIKRYGTQLGSEKYEIEKHIDPIEAEQKVKEKEKPKKESKNRFYIAGQFGFIPSTTKDITEKQYSGAELPQMPNGAERPAPDTGLPLPFEPGMNFLPDGRRTGLYSVMRPDNLEVLYQFSVGIRTYDILRLEFMYALSNSRRFSEIGTNASIASSYFQNINAATRHTNLDFSQQMMMINAFVDFKFNRFWVYVGAGIGAVENSLNHFSVSASETKGFYDYSLINITTGKSGYEFASLFTAGTYFEVAKDHFIDFNFKMINSGNISTSRDYKFIQQNNINGQRIETLTSLNELNYEITNYVISLGYRVEF